MDGFPILSILLSTYSLADFAALRESFLGDHKGKPATK